MLAEIDGPQVPNRQGADPLTIQEVMAYYRVPGLSIAVIHDFAIDRAWVADVPDLKSCAAFGSTPDEAFAEVRIAMDAWLAVARDAGLEIPRPQFRPHHEAAE
jgi:predicted RNase H-like HicB family nuclease